MLVRCPKLLPLVDDKRKQPEEIGLAKPVSIANGTVLKVVIQNTGEAALLIIIVIRILYALKLKSLGQSWSQSCWANSGNLLSYPDGVIFKVA